MAAESNNLDEILTPFYQRATEAEERLAKLEASLSKNKEEQSKLISELRLELENAKAEQISEREKAIKEVKELTAENGKLKYRIIHLVRAVREADAAALEFVSSKLKETNLVDDAKLPAR
ncbi:hypothetical protein ABFS82_10G161100 [Erythranthe guttata]|nr:PREDICTED: uncharacterized protein LOC105949302 [Erythranthe guttata]|eukprot:XP_012828044.1 PREDICTED: uncharacterized protein LOC105949302 [Erythranthe guttata]